CLTAYRSAARASDAAGRGFFCQAEDGIRDFHVTGVQTCALPISVSSTGARSGGIVLPRRHPLRLGGDASLDIHPCLASSGHPRGHSDISGRRNAELTALGKRLPRSAALVAPGWIESRRSASETRHEQGHGQARTFFLAADSRSPLLPGQETGVGQNAPGVA